MTTTGKIDTVMARFDRSKVDPQVLEVLDREDEARLKAEERQREINAKRNVQHPLYEWLRVDMRTQREVEETRKTEPITKLNRRNRKAKLRGMKMKVERDSDGAFRMFDRLDGKPSGVEVH